jgi:hypothetical protein
LFITQIDLLDIGITNPIISVINKRGTICYKISALQEHCAIDACVQVGEAKNINTSLLLMQAAIKLFQLIQHFIAAS